MMLATSIFEWLYKNLGQNKYGNYFFHVFLSIYQHLIFFIRKIIKKKIVSQANVKLFFFSGKKNFGDSLNHDLMRYLEIGYSPVSIDDANCICIGSILDEVLLTKSRTLKFSVPINVFGAGFMMQQEDSKEQFNRPVNIFILRGRLSLERCRNISHSNLYNVVLGDPGLLVKRIFPELIKKYCYDVGIICHLKDKDSYYIQNIQLNKKKQNIYRYFIANTRICFKGNTM